MVTVAHTTEIKFNTRLERVVCVIVRHLLDESVISGRVLVRQGHFKGMTSAVEIFVLFSIDGTASTEESQPVDEVRLGISAWWSEP